MRRRGRRWIIERLHQRQAGRASRQPDDRMHGPLTLFSRSTFSVSGVRDRVILHASIATGKFAGRYGGSDPLSGGHHSSARAPPPPLVLIRSGERRCVVNRPAGGKITPPHILRRRREVIASISRLGAAKGASRFTLNKNTDRVTIDIDCGRRTCHYHGRGDTACSICRILPPSF
jgi:hypothetical protein